MKYQPRYNDSWALIIGINKYRHVGPLEIARADAEAIRDVLIGTLGFAKENVCTLLDAQATRDRIMKQFLSYESTSPDDRLIVFFAGHGHTVAGSRGAIGYLVPVDGRVEHKSSLIRWTELTENADIIPAKHILFMMDACYSGLAIQRSVTLGERRFVRDMIQRRARQVITAGKADEVVADGGGPTGNNSIFTGYLLQGLQGEAADDEGVITASAVMNYAYTRVGRDSRSSQTPHFGHVDGDGDFIIRTPEDVHLDPTSDKDFLIKPILDQPEPTVSVDWTSSAPRFADRNGYSDPELESFGRNEWSKNLGEANGEECRRAFGWLSLVVEPVTREPLVLDISALALSLPGKMCGDVESNRAFAFPNQSVTTSRSLLLYESDSYRSGPEEECWHRYLRIERGGSLEYCDYDRVARRVKLSHEATQEYAVFFYVPIIGTIWTFLQAAKSVLVAGGFSGGIRYSVNVVGTKNSILADFARAPGADGQKWRQPFEADYFGIGDSLTKWRCRDANLQFPFQVVLSSLRDAELQKIVRECADQFGLAYNHKSAPRCFPPGSDEFPWREFRPSRKS